MKHLKGTRFSKYTVEGQDNPLWQWKSTTAMLAAFLQDETQAKADRDRAAEILSWCAEREKSGVNTFFDDLFAHQLFEHPEHWSLQNTVVNGAIVRDCVCNEAALNASCPQSESRYDKPKVLSAPPEVEVEGGDI
jgi:hypothetical protein